MPQGLAARGGVRGHLTHAGPLHSARAGGVLPIAPGKPTKLKIMSCLIAWPRPSLPPNAGYLHGPPAPADCMSHPAPAPPHGPSPALHFRWLHCGPWPPHCAWRCPRRLTCAGCTAVSSAPHLRWLRGGFGGGDNPRSSSGLISAWVIPAPKARGGHASCHPRRVRPTSGPANPGRRPTQHATDPADPARPTRPG
jgi:hypothetical protein